jgi:hypothetical protein
MFETVDCVAGMRRVAFRLHSYWSVCQSVRDGRFLGASLSLPLSLAYLVEVVVVERRLEVGVLCQLLVVTTSFGH